MPDPSSCREPTVFSTITAVLAMPSVMGFTSSAQMANAFASVISDCSI
ncbi:hypothetical protein [Streptomyces achromogenes]